MNSSKETLFWRRLSGTVALTGALIAIFGFATGKFTFRDAIAEVRSRWIYLRAQNESEVRVLPEARPETLLRIKAQIEIDVSDYNSTVTSVRAGRAPVEQALSKARRLARDLMYESAEDGFSTLERMAPTDRLQFAQRVPGIRLWYHETQGVEIDPAFFFDLASRCGNDADRLFFTNYRLTFPGGYGWPGYIEQQTDYSGCTKYGSDTLADAYARWSAFRRRFPVQYIDEVDGICSEIEGEFLSGTCACGGPESVVSEFSRFVARFPNSSITPQVTERLNAIISGASKIRFNCVSG